MNEEQMKAALKMLAALASGEDGETALKDAVGTPTFTPLHGITGIFSGAGVERDVISARVTPQGLGAALRRYPSVFEDPRFSSITGYTETTGTRPTTSCADATRGHMKSCELTAVFGLNRQDSQEIEMDKVGLRANRGDHMDLRLRGDLLGMTGFTPSGLNQQQVMTVVTMSEMVKMAAYLENEMAVDLWTGNPSTSAAFPGLDRQIATGQVDARTNTTCPALDSDVKDFNYNDVDGVALDIVTYLSQLEWYLRFNARRMGLMPVEWVIVMRPELWYELSAVWPCRYLTHRCANSGGTNIAVINDNTNVTLRDAMRENMYISINGNQYPVVIDDGIFEHNNINNGNLAAGEYASSIYMVPLTIQGGFPVTYMEYLDYRASQVDTALLRGKENYWWTDNGMYSWSITDLKGWCYQLHMKTEQRVIVRTPQLAGKVQRVKYSPLQHLRSPFPENPYNADGGVSMVNPTNRYAVWFQGAFGGA